MKRPGLFELRLTRVHALHYSHIPRVLLSSTARVGSTFRSISPVSVSAQSMDAVEKTQGFLSSWSKSGEADW